MKYDVIICLFFVVEHLQFELQFSFQFKNTRKLGGEDLLNEKVEVLRTEIADQFHVFRAKNDKKFRATWAIVCGILSTAATILGILLAFL